MLLWLCDLLFKLKGWHINEHVPEGSRNSILLAMPHTSNWDLIFALSGLKKLGLKTRFTIKKEHNRWPYGGMLSNAGAFWVDRSPKVPGQKRRSMVEIMTEIVQDHKGQDFVMMITPEGTRSPNDHWKTGFYHIAMNTGVPIALAYLDYEKKEAGVGMCFYPTGDMKADMKKLIDFYATITPAYPEKYLPDVGHLE